MPNKHYNDRLDNILLPEYEAMQFIPGGILPSESTSDLFKELNPHTTYIDDITPDKESPEHIARNTELRSLHFIHS